MFLFYECNWSILDHSLGVVDRLCANACAIRDGIRARDSVEYSCTSAVYLGTAVLGEYLGTTQLLLYITNNSTAFSPCGKFCGHFGSQSQSIIVSDVARRHTTRHVRTAILG